MARSRASNGARQPAPANKQQSNAGSPVIHQSSIVEGAEGFFWRDSETDALDCIKRFDYEDFRDRLS